MKKIKFAGWRKGMNKIEFIQLLRNNTELSLQEAKNIKDKIVDGETVEILVESDVANYILDESKKYGVLAKILRED